MRSSTGSDRGDALTRRPSPVKAGLRDRREAARRSPVVVLVHPAEDSRDMYAEYLRHSGFTVLVFANADAACHAAADADVIVTSITLPGAADGVALIRRLRRETGTRDIPIIAVSAWAMPGDRERVMEAGGNLFLAKPCLPDDLLREMHRLLRPGRRRRA